MKIERVSKNVLKKGPLTIGNWPKCGLKRSSKEAKARPKKSPMTRGYAKEWGQVGQDRGQVGVRQGLGQGPKKGPPD